MKRSDLFWLYVHLTWIVCLGTIVAAYATFPGSIGDGY